MGWTVGGTNPSGARFSARPDRPLDPPSLQYNGYRVFHGDKVRPGRAADHTAPSVPRSWKSRAIPLPTLWATPGPVTKTLYVFMSIRFPVVYRLMSFRLKNTQNCRTGSVTFTFYNNITLTETTLFATHIITYYIFVRLAL